MRSTAFISAVAALSWPLAAAAEAPSRGCYARDYTEGHLAAHPAQVVSWMRLSVGDVNEAGETEAELRVGLADQGRARAEGLGGQALAQRLICKDRGQGLECGVECDGGVFSVEEDASGLSLTTDRLMVGEGEDCGGSFDLAEHPGEAVTYRLERAAPALCEVD